MGPSHSTVSACNGQPTLVRYGDSRSPTLYREPLAPIEAIELFNVHCSSLLEFRDLLCNRRLGLGHDLDLCLRAGAFGRLSGYRRGSGVRGDGAQGQLGQGL